MHRYLLLLFLGFQLHAGTVFFSGNLRTDATVVDCGPSCKLDGTSLDSDYAQFAAFVAPFTVSSLSTVQAVTFGFGGGVSATGPVVAPGGLEPYLSLFDSAGNFLSSTFFGTTCPAGANTWNGACLDVSLDAGTLAPGTYQIALTAFENLSLAENLGSGILADGFGGLGNLGGRETLNFAFDVNITSLAATPEPGSMTLMSGAAAAIVIILVVKKRKEQTK